LSPTFALDFLAYVLIVVTLGGHGSMKGALAAALLLGVVDVAGKYYIRRPARSSSTPSQSSYCSGVPTDCLQKHDRD